MLAEEVMNARGMLVRGMWAWVCRVCRACRVSGAREVVGAPTGADDAMRLGWWAVDSAKSVNGWICVRGRQVEGGETVHVCGA